MNEREESKGRKSVIRIRFNWTQRMRVMFGHKVYVVMDQSTLPPYEAWAWQNDYLGEERLSSEVVR